jgi:hypothetical protein
MITYTEIFTASGTLGTHTFTDAMVTITGTGDTANASGGVNVLTTASVSVAGISGTGTFNDSIAAFATGNNKQGGTAGFADVTSGGMSIVVTANTAFASYDLTTSIGPVSGSNLDISIGSLSTSAGGFSFQFDSMDLLSSFTATLATTATPEPASLTLLGLGVASLAGYAWRRRR